jgi:hypothetical protein
MDLGDGKDSQTQVNLGSRKTLEEELLKLGEVVHVGLEPRSFLVQDAVD